MENNFLSQFHKTAFRATGISKWRGKSSILFRLTFERGAAVTVVDENGNVVTPDYKQFQGETFNVLRMMDNIRQEQAMRDCHGLSSGSGVDPSE